MDDSERILGWWKVSYRLRETILCEDAKIDSGTVSVKLQDDPTTDTNHVQWTFKDKRGEIEFAVLIEYLPHRGIGGYVVEHAVNGRTKVEPFDLYELAAKLVESASTNDDD
jgi:hypothetical protein